MPSERSLAVILWLILLPVIAIGQPNYRFFYGKITDRSSGSALFNVNISILNTKVGTVSDKRGQFSFFIDTIPVYMIVSHVGYETQKIWLDGTSYNISIQLERMTRTLDEVEIRSVNPPEPFYRDYAYSVLDYIIDRNRIYILIYRFSLSEAQIICRSGSGDTLGVSGTLAFKPVRLFRDCIGFVHLLSNDTAYQVDLSGNQVILSFPAAVKRFMETLNDCVASTDKLLFFKRSIDNGLGIEFYSIDRFTSQRETMSFANDNEKSDMLRRNTDDLRLMQMNKPPDSRSDFVQWSFAKKILYRPNTSSLHKLGDRICVFNTVERSIEFYTLSGEFTGKLIMPVENVADGKWTNEIYIDEITGKAYTSFMKNGSYTLFRVNLNTGELRLSLPLTHLFPQRIHVDNGFLYYMFDVPEQPDNKQLYRQKL